MRRSKRAMDLCTGQQWTEEHKKGHCAYHQDQLREVSTRIENFIIGHIPGVSLHFEIQ